MLKEYNAYIKILDRLITIFLVPIGSFAVIIAFYFVGNQFGMTVDNELDAFGFTTTAAMLAALIHVSIIAVLDYTNFASVLNKKSNTIEYFKTSKRGEQFFNRLTIEDVVVRTVCTVVNVFVMAAAIKIVLSVINSIDVSYVDILKNISLMAATMWAIGCVVILIDRHMNNPQIFAISIYVVAMVNVVIAMLLSQMELDVNSDLGIWIGKNGKYLFIGIYLAVGVLASLFVILKSRKIVKKSWYIDN